MSVAAFTPLTKTDIATILQVTPRTIENFVNQGILPPPRAIGGRVFWHPDIFYTWLDSTLRDTTSHQSTPDDPDSPRPTLSATLDAPSKGAKKSAVERSQARQRNKLMF